MKRFIALAMLCAMLLSAFAIGVSAADTTGLVDSGIDYTESTEAFGNPMAGYPSTQPIFLALSGNQTYNNKGFVHYFIDMRMFSGGYTRNEAGERVPLTPEQTADRVKCNGVMWEWNNGERNEGGPEDIPLNEDALNALRGTFENLRNNGGTCLVRPEYAINADVNNEPYDFDIMLTHAKQLCAIFTEYSDVIGGIEIGTIGPFGEMHSSVYCAAKYSNRILQTYMDYTPKTIKMMVRSPRYLLNYICGDRGRDTQGRTYLKDGTDLAVMLDGKKSFINLLPFDNLRDVSQEDMKRLSMYNDGYMLTSLDTGTWKEMPRADGVSYVAWAAFYGYYGGEYGSGKRYEDFWLPEKALPEMYKTHVSYINGNIYKSTMGSVCWWKTQQNFTDMDDAIAYVNDWYVASQTITDDDSAKNVLDLSTVKYEESNGHVKVIMEKCGYDQIPFTEELAKMSTKNDVSAYYGRSVYSFMRDHLGYRFVVRSSKLSNQVDRGGVLSFNMSVENTGFGNCVQDKVSQLVIKKDGIVVDCIDLDSRVDSNAWYTQETTDFAFSCRLANTLEAGEYDAYLRVCNVTHAGEPNTKTTVRFANNGTYDPATGANYIGSFTVGTKTADLSSDTSGQVTVEYADVVSNHWAMDDIKTICAAGYMNGTSPTTFAPDAKTWRGMLVTVLYRIEGEPDVSSVKNPFTDVKSTAYYANAVKWAFANNIVNGKSATSFAPEVNLTREEFAKIVYAYAQYKGVNTSAKGDLSKFTDKAKVNSWALDAITWANGEGIITGIGDTIAPQGETNRAQMAAILRRYLAKQA